MTTYKDILAQKYVQEYPTVQNALNIFAGRWASRVPNGLGGFFESGDAEHFTGDPGPLFAAYALGNGLSRLDDMNVLELGPLEGGDTYQLEHLGAKVTAIEANAEAFLKCLIVKEVLNLKARFYLGDFRKYLETSRERFDLIFASGVLYHMTDPLKLIASMAKHTDRVFVWTHYWRDELVKGRVAEAAEHRGFKCIGYRLDYGDRQHGRFWGGLEDHSIWLPQESILDAFRYFGLQEISVHEDNALGENGPSISFSARRHI